ncbi:MAG TPA: hypothetical protein VKP65_10075 [Rhodothermales bacterium]|nr:hypothetical protein [Rhodothermales bacterium]
MSIVVIAIWAVVILVGLGLLTMLVFGARSLAHGKIKPLSMVIVIFPIVLLGIMGLVLGDWPLAAIYTFFIVFLVATLSLFLSGIRGLFT